MPGKKRGRRSNDVLKAVIFDWDLTLWNSWDIHLWSMTQTADALCAERPTPNSIAREYNRPFSGHLARFFHGNQQQVLDTYLECLRVARGARQVKK